MSTLLHIMKYIVDEARRYFHHRPRREYGGEEVAERTIKAPVTLLSPSLINVGIVLSQPMDAAHVRMRGGGVGA
ncbi:hypothetical protein KUCAC02_021136 [Chaenocephalus aceratus]|uniref:Uncharacterized protein n=1 Tax=Chaenocephalus aceratus TaxID=36190 RepID=A0ACB9XFX4_CHAAC|nr:hypothetical protein KUCAC02_021136 [Chaenocephalus aceratus]